MGRETGRIEGVQFESLVRWGVARIEAALTKAASSGESVTDVGIGYDQQRFFYRITRDEPEEIARLFETPILVVPPMTDEWQEDYSDLDAAGAAWRRAWHEGRMLLGVFAAGLVARALERAHPTWTFGVHDDYASLEDDSAPTSVDPFLSFDDELG